MYINSEGISRRDPLSVYWNGSLSWYTGNWIQYTIPLASIKGNFVLFFRESSTLIVKRYGKLFLYRILYISWARVIFDVHFLITQQRSRPSGEIVVPYLTTRETAIVLRAYLTDTPRYTSVAFQYVTIGTIFVTNGVGCSERQRKYISNTNKPSAKHLYTCVVWQLQLPSLL